MGFWPTQRIISRHNAAWIIGDGAGNPLTLAAPDDVKEASYTLRLGPEVYVTSSGTQGKRLLGPGEQFSIPPGQFAMLLTEEFVRVPTDTLAFISIKARQKFRGLVNVSGFHVDPGFEGRLLFSVFNAGSVPIWLARGERLFPIWFADLVDDLGQRQQDAFPYPPSGRHAQQSLISTSDVANLQGHIASPGSLKVELENLRHTLRTYATVASVIGTLVVGAAVPILIEAYKSEAPSVVTCVVPSPATPPAANPVAPPPQPMPPGIAPPAKPGAQPPPDPKAGTSPGR